ncbi:MAG: SDR family NAD(P)-dependent oxidoreductase [Planctomycetes bacterium]|nr:SDR family NAD(P)-dependent oxidoreductase [Planctomycetota bacterium]
MSRDLKGKVIAITGASSGIGAAVAVECGARGMKVVLGGRDETRLREAAKRVEAAGGKAHALVCDVDRDEDVNRFIAETLRVFGALDYVYANAGYGVFATVMETTDAVGRAIFETNFYGTVRVIRAAVPVMLKAGGGHVLICSSAASEVAPPYYGFYAATKAAQDSIGGALRAEMTGTGVRVTTIHPVATRTEFFDRVAKHAGREKTPTGTPESMTQNADHVARCIVRAMARKNPPPEVWPSVGARMGIAFITAFPRIAAHAMRGHYKAFRANGAK